MYLNIYYKDYFFLIKSWVVKKRSQKVENLQQNIKFNKPILKINVDTMKI